MSVSPIPEPNAPYRGVLRWMEGVPSTQELGVMMALLFLGALLIIVAWHLARSFLTDHLTGFALASPWRLFWAAGSVLTGLSLLTVPLAMLDDIAARMGVGVVVLVLLLLSEARLGRGRRRRR